MQAKIEAEVLSYTERPYVNKKGENVVFRQVLVRHGSTVVLFSVADSANLKNFEGAKAVLTLEFYAFGTDVSAKCRVVSAVEPS